MLKKPLILNNAIPDRPAESLDPSLPARPDSYQELKNRIHGAVLKALDIENLRLGARPDVEKELAPFIEKSLATEPTPLSLSERQRLVDDVFDELFGLGPLQPLLEDPTISDILVNDYRTVYIERRGRLQRVDVTFRDTDHLMQVITR